MAAKANGSILIEACVDSVASALAAERGGAGRVELCDNLFDGGTTPSAGMILAVKSAVRIPVYVIIRPRGGGFVYEDHELGVMRLDIEAARLLGADGLVVGALTPAGMVDEDRLRLLVDAAGGLAVTFHRAFDLIRDQEAALETLVRHRVAHVLTSGGASTAIDGASAIGAIVRRAAGRIHVMAGGGIREETVQEIVHRTGVREVHVRGTRLAGSRMTGGREAVPLRKPMPEDESALEETDEGRIRDLVRLANG